MKTKIVTKGGDYKNGAATTSLWLGGRVSKTDFRIAVVGHIDELHGWLGILHADLDKSFFGLMIDSILYDIQRDLIKIMGEISCSDDKKQEYRSAYNCLSAVDLQNLEGICSNLTSFSMSGWSLHGEDGPFAAKIDLVCKIARGVERSAALLAEEYEVRDVILNYFNRLSDFLFILARNFGEIYRSATPA